VEDQGGVRDVDSVVDVAAQDEEEGGGEDESDDRESCEQEEVFGVCGGVAEGLGKAGEEEAGESGEGEEDKSGDQEQHEGDDEDGGVQALVIDVGLGGWHELFRAVASGMWL
jgi:hypothetical protein